MKKFKANITGYNNAINEIYNLAAGKTDNKFSITNIAKNNNINKNIGSALMEAGYLKKVGRSTYEWTEKLDSMSVIIENVLKIQRVYMTNLKVKSIKNRRIVSVNSDKSRARIMYIKPQTAQKYAFAILSILKLPLYKRVNKTELAKKHNIACQVLTFMDHSGLMKQVAPTVRFNDKIHDIDGAPLFTTLINELMHSPIFDSKTRNPKIYPSYIHEKIDTKVDPNIKSKWTNEHIMDEIKNNEDSVHPVNRELPHTNIKSLSKDQQMRITLSKKYADLGEFEYANKVLNDID